MTIKIKYLKVETKEVKDCTECPHFEKLENWAYPCLCEVEFDEHYYEANSIEELIELCPFK